MNRKNLTVLAILAIPVSVLAYLYFSKQVSNTAPSVTTIEDCANDPKPESLIGRWTYSGGEVDSPVWIDLNSDNTFVASAWGGDSNSTSGTWNQIGTNLVLKFNMNNSYWSKTDEPEFNSSFKSMGINFQKSTNELTVPIGYGEVPEHFEGKCKESMYLINMMNFYLYK